MYVNNAGQTASTSPVSSTGASLSPAEINAQVAANMGYLALLINEDLAAPGTPGIQQQIEAVTETLLSEKGSVTDPTVLAMYNDSKISGVITQYGNVSLAGEQAFTTAWNGANGASGVSTMAQAWFSGADTGGVPPFNFQDATDPNTTFAYIMFVASLPPSNGRDQFGDYFNYGNNPILGCASYQATFLAAYAASQVASGQGPGLSVISALLNNVNSEFVNDGLGDENIQSLITALNGYAGSPPSTSLQEAMSLLAPWISTTPGVSPSN